MRARKQAKKVPFLKIQCLKTNVFHLHPTRLKRRVKTAKDHVMQYPTRIISGKKDSDSSFKKTHYHIIFQSKHKI